MCMDYSFDTSRTFVVCRARHDVNNIENNKPSKTQHICIKKHTKPNQAPENVHYQAQWIFVVVVLLFFSSLSCIKVLIHRVYY